jgi:hypothetical protein
MKRIAALVAGFVASFAFLAAFVFAATAPAHAQIFNDACARTPSATVCKEQSKNQTKADNSIYGKNGVIMKATNILAIIVGATATVVIMVSGLRYIFSSGDSGSISSAKRGIIYALVGIVIALAGRSIIAFILNKL